MGDAAEEVELRIKDLEYWALYMDICRNQVACVEFLDRLRTRHHYTVALPSAGHPTHIRGFHHGPYWSYLQPIYGNKRATYPPNSVRAEWHALCAQAIRYRKAILALSPSMPLHFLFPLNLLKAEGN